MKGSHRPGIGLVLVFLLLHVVYTFAPALLYNMAERKAGALSPADSAPVPSPSPEAESTPPVPAESLLPGASLAEYADMMLGMAKRARVPVALHFDHGFSPELVEEAIRLGFSSVMYDCSMLPFEENARRTLELAAK